MDEAGFCMAHVCLHLQQSRWQGVLPNEAHARSGAGMHRRELT